MSDTFTLDLPAKTVAIAFMQGLEDGDRYLVEYQTTAPSCQTASDGVYVPFSPSGCQWIMDNKFNPQRFDTPGTYRFVRQGALNPLVAFDYKLYPV